MTGPFDPEANVDNGAKLLGLTILTEWRPIVVQHLTRTAAAAELILSFPLDDQIELAPVFEP
jgi:Protein of unknown function (DUF4089)